MPHLSRFLPGPLLTLCLLPLLFACTAFSTEHPALQAFPPASQKMERFVIELPDKSRSEEGRFKVELIPGRTMLTDGVNLVRLGATIEPRSLQGWGYTFYEVTGTGPAMSTMMAPPEGAPKTERFISGKPLLIRYNSRLPVVIYAPKGYEIRYRIWKGDSEMRRAKTR